MRAPRDRHFAVVAVVGLLGLPALAHNMHLNAIVWRNQPPAGDSQLYLPEGDSLKLAVLGHDMLAADLFWLRAVSLFGDRTEGDGDEDLSWFDLLYHLIDLTTDLDPAFTAPYRMGGQMLHSDAGHVEHSNFVFYKGMQAVPTEWWFPFSIGMSYLIDYDDRIAAAPYVQRASELPGAPFYLKNLAASILSDGGSLDAAIFFIEQQLSNTPPGREREALEVKLPELRHERASRTLTAARERFIEAEGREPDSPEELVPSYLAALPEEPLRGCAWVVQATYQHHLDETVVRYESACRREWLTWVSETKGLGSELRTLDPFLVGEQGPDAAEQGPDAAEQGPAGAEEPAP